MRHQIVDRDGPTGRFGPVEGPARVEQNPHVRQLRQPLRHRVGQRELAFLGQAHGSGDSDGFGHRGDAEDRLALHRQTGVDVPVPERVDLQDLTGLPHQSDRAGELSGADRLLNGRLIAVELHRRQRTEVRGEGSVQVRRHA